MLRSGYLLVYHLCSTCWDWGGSRTVVIVDVVRARPVHRSPDVHDLGQVCISVELLAHTPLTDWMHMHRKLAVVPKRMARRMQKERTFLFVVPRRISQHTTAELIRRLHAAKSAQTCAQLL